MAQPSTQQPWATLYSTLQMENELHIVDIEWYDALQHAILHTRQCHRSMTSAGSFVSHRKCHSTLSEHVQIPNYMPASLGKTQWLCHSLACHVHSLSYKSPSRALTRSNTSLSGFTEIGIIGSGVNSRSLIAFAMKLHRGSNLANCHMFGGGSWAWKQGHMCQNRLLVWLDCDASIVHVTHEMNAVKLRGNHIELVSPNQEWHPACFGPCFPPCACKC